MSYDIPTFSSDLTRKIAEKLGLANEPWMQDWPIEVADGARLEEFLCHYESETKPEYRRVIAQVLLVSLDAAFLRAHPSDVTLTKLAKVFKMHPDLLGYWLCLDEESSEEEFAITPWLRSNCC